jgi:hypothetical protein
VSVCYGILAAMYFGILAILVDTNWSGSVGQLWTDLKRGADVVVPLGALLVLHVTLSGATFEYPRHSPRTRLTILSMAVLLFGLAIHRVIAAEIDWRSLLGQPALAATSLLAIGYGLCAWILWRVHATANNALERTRDG